MKQKIKLTIIALAIVILGLLNNKSMASTECKNIPEEQVKYINATLTQMNREQYNAMQRGMWWGDYYDLPIEQRGKIDEKSMLMASTEGMCISGIQNGYIDVLQYGNSTGVMQGLVKKKLINDNLHIIDKYTNKDSFFPKNASNTDVYIQNLKNWKMPFIREKNGYYSFNSDKYHVCRDYDTTTLKLHEGARDGFYPFNECLSDTFIPTNRELGFTVRMDIPFIMTKDGKVKNTETKQYEDMVFNFSGDDDVWVFVDDKLVLDLGGNHIRLTGNINFAKNQVYYESIYNPISNEDEKDVYKNAFDTGMLSQGKHTLKVFYMERAGGGSNLFVNFNLQSGGIQANYIDKDSGKSLDMESQSGPLGESVTTQAKSIEGYTLIEKPGTESYILSEELQNVNYYYSKNSKVITKYVNEFTNEEIATSETITGLYGQDYETKLKKIYGYEFSKIDGKAKGTMNGQDIVVTYYYKHKNKVIINYIDKETNEKIDTISQEVYEGDTYTSNERSYEDYELVQRPLNETVKIQRQDITLNYYYKKLKFNLQIEMNLDKALINGNYYGLNGKLGKIETEIRDANKKSTLQIFYKIKVTNNQERIGDGYITFTIPKGYTMLNEDWEISGNQAKYKVSDLGIGETREYQVILEKNKDIDIAGDIKAYVRVDSLKLQETTLEDNEDMNELAVMPRTGKLLIPFLPIILALSILAVVIYRKIKK